jgi:hypothetical protein
MMIQELTKEEKLRVIDKILANWKRYGRESYICNAVVREAVPTLADVEDNTNTAIALIPELLSVKPADVDIYNEHGWFGAPDFCQGERTPALLQVRKMIEEKI